MWKKVIVSVCLLFFAWLPVSGKSTISDSLSFYRPSGLEQWGEITRVSVPLMASSLMLGQAKYEFRDLRNELFAPGRVSPFDDYLQYSPAVVMLGLKAAGYQGRSSWGRMLVADAFSVAVMAALVNGIKYTAREMRPDGSTRNSFPSGHTATAFMAATMLHKEYGQTRSLWFSVGGYTAATVTGLMRVINNRHWVSDVVMGAGIGIFATELGYYLADLIFKEKGIRRELLPFASLEDPSYKPSFLRLDMGVSLIPGRHRLGKEDAYTFNPGAYMGLDGAWFFLPNVGVGAGVNLRELSFLGGPSSVRKKAEMYGGHLAAHFAYTVHPRISFSGQLNLGYTYADDKFFGHGMDFGTGVAITYKAYRRMGLSLRADYACWLPSLTVEKPEMLTSVRVVPVLHTLTLGGSVVFYW